MIKIKRKIVFVLLIGIMLTGCGNNAIAYFPYADGGTNTGVYEVTASESKLSLMSEGLCILTDKNVNNLNDKPSFNMKKFISH